ncbi:hypothetical protein PPACK8108_LOCUS19187, partial [Phakopsora pachyrhizi]
IILPSVRLIISFLLVFTVSSRISFRNLFTGTFPFIIVILIPSIPITLPPFIRVLSLILGLHLLSPLSKVL